jgi:hypothetical protein
MSWAERSTGICRRPSPIPSAHMFGRIDGIDAPTDSTA